MLSKKPAKSDSWDNVISLIKKARVPDTFLDADERNQPPKDKDPFAEIQHQV